MVTHNKKYGFLVWLRKKRMIYRILAVTKIGFVYFSSDIANHVFTPYIDLSCNGCGAESETTFVDT